MKHAFIKVLIALMIVLEIAQIVIGITNSNVSTADAVAITLFCVFGYGIVDWDIWEVSKLD